MPLFRVDATAAVAAALVTLPCLAADLLVPQQFGTIQEAVNAAAGGDRVLVSAGTYHEQVNLSGKGIQLIGVDGAAVTAIDGDNSRTVMVGNGEPSTCLVQGFTIQNGRDYGYHNGGGVRIYNSSVHFDSCQFVRNHAEAPSWWGGGAWRSEYGNPVISNCVFAANFSGGGIPGIYHYLGGGINISDCVFTDNACAAGSAQCIHIQTEGGTISASIQRCIFRRSETPSNEGYFSVGFWNPYGGSISCPISDCSVEEPEYPSDTPPGIAAFMAIGSYPDSPYNITLTNIQTCGLPTLVYSDSNSTWSNGGGNTLTANCCPADLDSDGEVGGADISLVLLEFGDCLGCKSDLDGSGETNGGDLSALLLDFGSCQ